MNSQESAETGVRGGDEELLDRIGQLTRTLHESMRELGLDKEVERAAEAIPDARDRLTYIANTTAKSANRTLNAIDRAQPLQEQIATQAKSLDGRWDEWFDQPLDLADARELVSDTRGYLRDIPEQVRATNAELHEIMMAQDFQDLTGQVVSRLVGMIQHMESQLLEVLVEHSGHENRGKPHQLSDEDDDELMNGPQIQTEGRQDIVTDQSQVDDLLDELGF